MIVPSKVLLTIASSDESTIAARSALVSSFVPALSRGS